MYFDPLSAWLVSLIADGIIIAGEKSNRGAGEDFNQRYIKDYNKFLNGDIRRIKEKYGLILAEHAYKQIQLHIKATKKCLEFCTNVQITIDLDNQEYIISVLEECFKKYDCYYKEYSSEDYRQKAEWFRNSAIEARQRKDQYAKELEESRVKEAKEQEKQKTISNILMVVGLIIFVVFIIFFFS